ncbi:type II toxin-antitoxin system RatA family toxin [Mucilaginibacter ginsenosidivorans]|uniref:SRPBCC family protein n=1 Tax=Mucilaginibacter ginsenosidivorans TaxID=398053 RepID=A0A5B8V2S8_9SPHI|nr:SRPBCC family protein [Mucilaginibacter ginsenosidivorans]QEC65459.1 SRPBCC family protein [Mucilaginibacter ginsenosidivorans]
MRPLKLSEKILINKGSQLVFDYTQDYSNRLLWDTFLKKAELIDGAENAGVGVKAWCVARNGLGMETKYVTFNRPKNTAVKMTRGPLMFKSFSGSWLFRELEHEQTEVAFIYSFRLRFPFYIFKRTIKNSLQRNVRKRLADLKTCIEGT